MLHTFKSARFSVILVLLLLLGLVCDRQALAGQTTLQDIPPILHSYLPLIARSFGYVEPTGVLDSTFGDNGVLLTPMGPGAISDLIVQPDGKILAAGRVFGGTDWDIGLVRYYQDGSLDTSFGEDGKVITNLVGPEEPQAIARQPDGKIVVTGYTWGESTVNLDFFLARYHSDGSLDTSFDGDGWVTTDLYDSADYGYDVVVQRDGKIVVVGSVWLTNEDSDIVVVRYNSDGSLDTSFGNQGKVSIDFFNYLDHAYSVVLQEDSKIIVAGQTTGETAWNYVALARYTPSGDLDTSFGGDGLVTTDFGYGDWSEILLQPDNKIVVAGSVFTGPTKDLALIRYNPDGSLDTSFGEAGLVTTDWGCDEKPTALVLQPNSKIIATGFVTCNGNTAYILARYNLDGSLDNSFGYLGKVLTELGDGDEAYALGLQADGKIIVGGSGYDDSLWVFTLVRYK